MENSSPKSRPSLICNYSGESGDPQQYSSYNFTAEEGFEAMNSLLGESQENCNKIGLPPFFKLTPVPAVSTILCPALNILDSILCLTCQSFLII